MIQQTVALVQSVLHEAWVSFWSLPSAPLIAIVALCALLVCLIAYVLFSASSRAEDRVADLVRQLDQTSAKLVEAEQMASIGSFVWDLAHAKDSFWSPQLYRVLGLVPRRTPPELTVLADVAHADDKQRVSESITAAMQHAGKFSLDFRVNHNSGETHNVHVDGVSEAPKSAAVTRIKGVVRDVTKETTIDRAKTEFVSLASHQLKAPLTSIRWLAESLLSGIAGELTPKQREFLTKVHEESVRMVDMVNDLLNMSRIELGTLSAKEEDIDMCALLGSVADEQQQTAVEKHISLQLTCQADLPHVFGDGAQTRMVMQNLISNAIKYTPPGGTVSCDLSVGGAGKEAVFIRVADTGIGIPKAEQGRVFEKLHRATNAQSFTTDGTGLGLYVVKTVLERAGGGITFESVEGKGTTFYASVPTLWNKGAPQPF